MENIKNHHRIIMKEFAVQASGWKKEDSSVHMKWLIEEMDLNSSMEVLDVAAGSCIFSKAISPYVSKVTAVDITPEMLDASQIGTDQNILCKVGSAENLPFETETFDFVVSRYSIHHFLEPQVVVNEMFRVCKAGGCIALVDATVPEDEELAKECNRIERAEDPSHVEAVSLLKLREFVTASGFLIKKTLLRQVPELTVPSPMRNWGVIIGTKC